MRILALETASIPASVALLDAGSLLAERTLERDRRTTETLCLVVQDLMKQHGWSGRDVDLVTTTIGPGSFTGLRIGATLAKVFAYATGAQVLGIRTLDVIAAQAGVTGQVVAAIDAQRGELFSATFRLQDDHCEAVCPTQICSVDAWLDRLPEGSYVTGTGLKLVQQRLPNHVRLVPSLLWAPRAAMLGTMARKLFVAGERQDCYQLCPEYFRKSAAEEKADVLPKPQSSP